MRARHHVLTLAASAAFALAGAAASAQGVLDPGPAGNPIREVERSQYSARVGKLTPIEIIQQKAQAKASERAGRIASREWFGYSQARPTTLATPFTGIYGPQNQGYVLGRPDAIHAQRPVVVFVR